MDLLLHTPQKRVSDMTCEDLRSELKKMRRKSSGSKTELQHRIRQVCDENNRGWLGRTAARASWGSYLASGEHRHVWGGHYLKGPRKDEESVVKVFKTGSVFEDKFFEKDILAVEKAAALIKSFNSFFDGWKVGENAMQSRGSISTGQRFGSMGRRGRRRRNALWSQESLGHTTSSTPTQVGSWTLVSSQRLLVIIPTM